MKDQNLHFKTSDFCLASYLLAKNAPFIGINKDSSGRADFIFRNTKKTQQLEAEFLSMKAVVEPMAFFSAQKRLKHLIYL